MRSTEKRQRRELSRQKRTIVSRWKQRLRENKDRIEALLDIELRNMFLTDIITCLDAGKRWTKEEGVNGSNIE